MADNVIPFPKAKEEMLAISAGNGAYEALLSHILETGCTEADGEAWVEYTLADLWVRGFMVVPID